VIAGLRTIDVMRAVVGLAVFVVVAGSCDRVSESEAQAPSDRGAHDRTDSIELDLLRLFGVRPREPYVLDEIPRRLAPGDRVDCESVPLVTYRGSGVRYARPVRIHPAFEARLSRFETVVRETAISVYGRPPSRIEHAGTFACRSVRGRNERLSEHALGNAIDVSGFRFGPASRAERAAMPAELPARLRWGFGVRIDRDWEGDGAIRSIHRRFLATLTERLRDEPIFRGMIGPRHPRHRNHLHLDAGPYRYDWL
jgi:hypothetical protein